MRRARRTIDTYRLAVAGLVGFVAGVVATAVVVRPGSIAADSDMTLERVTEAPLSRTAERTIADVVKPAAATPHPVPRLSMDPTAELRDRDLLVPVRGVDRAALRSSFDERRGGTRRHEAMDILAPRHTPVIAVERGTIARLFSSDRGGITIYQFDPTGAYVYYYAHLQQYADGLKEGAAVEAGQVIGYVGTSGNAPPETPHLHFAIFKLTDEKRWWEGAPIDPYPVLR
jgi:murein DD-endopeptidase MepM/ murein hydrolase activator NlpD